MPLAEFAPMKFPKLSANRLEPRRGFSLFRLQPLQFCFGRMRHCFAGLLIGRERILQLRSLLLD